MFSINRRSFLSGAVLTTAVSSVVARNKVSLGFGAEGVSDPHSENFSPDTLFLTWQQDPTTTMTIQWLGEETSADMSVRFSPLSASEFISATTKTKPYLNTDLKVFRCELVGLSPGTEYKFQIGKSFPS